ncbi:MAG TPA: APC family permease [Streptosporangiaceae bacterium]|jgi:amino acid transporter|nr:APC family permease [Streptosporangiaceae bacterium]
MTDYPAATVSGIAPAPPARLEPDAIGVAQDTVIGMASSAPAVCVALTLAPLALATAYGGVASIVLTAIPMLIIANAYRRLNMWNANCGASFEWVGRAINPYLGFMTGWLMIAGYIIGAIAGVVVLGPSVLAVFTSSSGSTWTNVGIATAISLAMLVIAIIGIRITARTQVGMAVVEYTILIGFAVVGLIEVLHHHHGTFPISKGWFSPSGIGGKGSLVSGLLLSVFIFSGWEGTLYVNEETKHRRINPGRAAIMAVILLTIIYSIAQLGLQGLVSPAKLQSHSTSALVYVAQALGGSDWSKVMALALALSVIAATLTNIVLTSRIMYGMASYRTLPEVLSGVSRRFATPVAASVVVGVLLIGLTWVYLLAGSLQNAFTSVIDTSGLLFAAFYILTALATIVYYRRRLVRSPWDALILGILPIAAAVFLGWIIVKSIQGAAASQNYSLIGVVVLGAILMFVARYVLESPFFQIQRESDGGRQRRH